MKSIDLTGKTFNFLTVIQEAAKSNSGKRRWLCRCACGTEKIVHGYAITSEETKSCGCKRNELQVAAHSSHMMSGTDIYAVWTSMKSRCLNKNDKNYYRYGGRGISVCTRWRESFAAFISDMGPRPADHSIERSDNNGPYEPSNCHWSSQKDQVRNRRNTKFLSIGNETKPLAELAEIHGLPYDTVYQRKLRGASDEQALSLQNGHHKYLTLEGVTKSLTDWAGATGIKKTTIQMRLRAGWTVQKTLTYGVTA